MKNGGKLMENKEIFVKDIVNICNAELVCGNKNEICKNFSKDTRTINSGDVYIGIKGENFDGNTLWKEALEKGAKTIIIQGIDFSREDLTKFEKENKENYIYAKRAYIASRYVKSSNYSYFKYYNNCYFIF